MSNGLTIESKIQQNAVIASGARGILRRKCACGNHTVAGGRCTECGKKGKAHDLQGDTTNREESGNNTSSLRAQAIQGKVAIGASDDPLEREADRIADQVMSIPANSAFKNAPPRIQRFSEPPAGQTDTVPAASVDRVLTNSGSPLEPGLRAGMEQRFGHDFSHVRVHSGAAAEQSAHEVNASAYTVGHNIVFGGGHFTPATKRGQRLIAHELTHTIQQNGAPPSRLQRSVDTVAPSTEEEHPVAELNEEFASESPLAPPSTRPTVPIDSDCPNYESDERSTSHREPGHLDPDVERLAPNKLLIGDFGVDWPQVKRSTSRDPTLQAWLTAWESDDSYRLTIIGYSDCVSTGRLNTRLRQSRAANIEALLGPRAKSRTTFRGMAALGNYITNNNTLANRARNRGVIIEFHQEFEFPPEEINVTPQYCGPNSTGWLLDQMHRNRDHPVIKTQREMQWPNWIPIFNLGWNYGALSDFRDLVRAGAPWDFKSNQKQWRSKAGNTCPSVECDKTVRLCGKCFSYDVPGNIHYGYIGRMAAIRAWFLHNRAAAAQVGGVDPAHDTAAINIGIAMADQGATLCDEITTHESELNRDETEGCGSCPTAT